MKRLRNCLEEVPNEKKINCPKAGHTEKKENVHGRDESRYCRVLYLEKEVEFFPERRLAGSSCAHIERESPRSR